MTKQAPVDTTCLFGVAGSPRPEGNSTSLLAEAAAGAAACGARTEVVRLNDLQYAGCQACDRCQTGRACPVHDDLTPVVAMAREADVLLLASPIYYDGVTGQMKLFFDRCRAHAHPEPARRRTGRRAAGIIITYEDKPRADYRRVAEVLAGYLGWWGDYGTVKILAGARLGPVGAVRQRPELLAEAHDMGRTLVEELTARRAAAGPPG